MVAALAFGARDACYTIIPETRYAKAPSDMPALTPQGFPRDSELGALLTRVGELIDAHRFADAIPLMTKVVEQRPDNGPVHANLGGLYIETGQYPEAVKFLRRAAELSPGIALIHWRLGMALQASGDAKGAVDAYESAVELRPDLVDAHLRLAVLYRQQGRQLDSREQYRIAALLSDDPARQKFLEAQALLDERQEEEAQSLLRSALQMQPDLPGANGVLGQVLVGLGRFDEAAKHFEAEIVISPQGAPAYYDLARCRKTSEGDEKLLQQIDTALAQHRLGESERSMMLLARSKMLDDLGRYEAAMKSMDEASVLRKRAFGIEVDSFETRVDQIISFFSAERITRHTLANHDRTPVIIMGMPRSGTTLVEQIVSSHPDSKGGSELSYWTGQLNTVLNGEQGGPSADFMRSCAAEYLGALRLASATASRVSDKNPFNFLALGLIHLAFPRAAIIHCKRQLIDTALSIHQTYFTRSNGMPTGGEDLVRYFRAHERLMEHWRGVLPPGRIFEVNYEKLALSPSTEIPPLIAHLGLEWNPVCLTPHVNSQLVRTPSGWQVRQSINANSVNRWRRYEPWLGALASLASATPSS